MNKVKSSQTGYKSINNMTQQMRYGLAVNQRKILIYDEVDCDTIQESICYLNKLKYMDSVFKKEKPDIEIQINTVGGNVEDGLSLISLIEEMKQDGYCIITTNIGRGYSMGFLLSICGSVRKAYKYAKYMYHDIAYGIYGKHNDVLDFVDFANMLRKDVLDIATKYTNRPKEFFDEINKVRKDVFFSASDMIELKGVDIIV